jgi:hypothetical protein
MTSSPPSLNRKRLVKVSLDENTMGAASRDIGQQMIVKIGRNGVLVIPTCAIRGEV